MQIDRKIAVGDTVREASRPERLGMVVATHEGRAPRDKTLRWVRFRDGACPEIEAKALELIAPLPQIG